MEDISRLGPAAQQQIREKLGGATSQTPQNKYHNIPHVVRMDGGAEHKFDSRKEARRFEYLYMLGRTGVIRNLKLQPQFTLQESYIAPDGTRVQAIRYVADFSYEIQEKASGSWQLVVEDVKSRPTRTPQYRMKKKMMAERLGITVKEVTEAFSLD